MRFEEYVNGDNGKVKCGKCGQVLRRYEAFLSEKYLYLCNMCEEDGVEWEGTIIDYDKRYLTDVQNIKRFAHKKHGVLQRVQ